MITIFHGDDSASSRTAYLDFLQAQKDTECFRLDPKTIDLNLIGNFLAGGSLFGGKKILAIDNFLSIPKTNLDKVLSLFSQTEIDIVLWQDKTLTAVQLKNFPKAKLNSFKSDNKVFYCLNALRPKNLNGFIILYRQVLKDGLFDLFLYMLKGNLRRWLQGYSKYDQKLVVRTYLQVIELEFQYKSGQLALPKEIALERVLVPLLK